MVTKGVPAKHPIGDSGDHMTASGVLRLDNKEQSFTKKKVTKVLFCLESFQTMVTKGVPAKHPIGDNGYQGCASPPLQSDTTNPMTTAVYINASLTNPEKFTSFPGASQRFPRLEFTLDSLLSPL